MYLSGVFFEIDLDQVAEHGAVLHAVEQGRVGDGEVDHAHDLERRVVLARTHALSAVATTCEYRRRPTCANTPQSLGPSVDVVWVRTIIRQRGSKMMWRRSREGSPSQMMNASKIMCRTFLPP